MRLVLALTAIALLLAPAAASARSSPAECRRIAQQLVHFDAMKQRAAELDNALWVKRFEDHISDLEDRQAAICPEESAALQAAQQIRELLKLAAQGAITFFTMGMY